MKKMALKVTGMHCTSCEMLIKDALEDIGVKNAEISHKNGTVNLVYDDLKVKEKDIKTIIEHEGYKVVN